MTCAECERLYDAYLDGQLSGTLRLEFDAHRLRCRRCQQTIAMLEACTFVIGSDRRQPALSPDFTARVMEDIGARSDERRRAVRVRATRVAFVAGGLIQAAAVVIFAIMLPRGGVAPRSPRAETPVVAEAGLALTGVDDPSIDLREYVFSKLERGLRSTPAKWTEDMRQLAGYLNVSVPDSVARASADPRTLMPLFAIDNLISPAPGAAAPEPAADDESGARFEG
ncbi:MAG: hypothetical protein CHACPFDD_00731 [Phycisphaerae bacterium]|nr:hypothetical protein [Phycisphaerae bacterium]